MNVLEQLKAKKNNAETVVSCKIPISQYLLRPLEYKLFFLFSQTCSVVKHLFSLYLACRLCLSGVCPTG